MLTPELIGKNIKKYRERAGLTQPELASKLFVSFQAVSAWERGLTLPELENAAALAECLNVKLEVLLTDTDRKVYAAIDGGGTKTEFIVFEEDGVIQKRIVLEGSNPNDNGVDKSIVILTRGLDELLQNLSPRGIFGGIAGVTTGDHIQTITKSLGKRYGVQIFIDTDAVNVLCMGNDIKNTASLICGTGSCVFVRKDYKLTRLGGWGYLFDRAGSAYDIGNDAIRHALAVNDGLSKPTPLSSAVEERVGGNIWKNLSFVYEMGRPYIASFAPLAAENAAKGDRVSLDILEDNAKRLSELIKLAKTKHGAPNEFVGAGGFLKNEIFADMVESYSDIKLYIPDTQPIYGAAVECLRLNGITVGDEFKKNFLESYR